MEHLKTYFKNFYKLTENDLDLFQEHVHTDHLQHGDYFLKEGKVCHRMGFVEEGVLRYYTINDSGKELTCFFVSEDEFIGDPESFHQRKPCQLNLQAVTDCLIATIGLEDFFSILEKYPHFREISEDIGYKTVIGLLNKKNFQSGSNAIFKYRQFIRQFPGIFQRVPLGYIASYLDITQQSLSRIRKQV